MTLADLARVLRAAADECDRCAQERASERFDWVEQGTSPLGRKRHCAAVRRLVGAGHDGAAIVGRRHLLSPSALREVLGESGRASAAPAQPSVAQELERRLRLVGGEL